MKPQPDLFAETLPTAEDLRALPVTQALRISANRLSPAQTRFNQLLARIEAQTQRLAEVRAAVDAHRPRASAVLQKLHAEQAALNRRMVLLLHERLQRKASLTVTQKRTATEILCQLSLMLAQEGDAEMQAVHDQHSPHTFAAMQEASAADLRAAYADALGEHAPETLDPNDPESFLHAAMRKLREQAQEADEKRRAKQQARKAAKPKSAKQKQAEQVQMDAQSALRTVFRQLASALHPDRETDPTERQRKTALMSRANAAYERRDLTELLQLQLELAQADPQAVAQLADDKLKALCALLKEQADALAQDLRDLSDQACHEFALPPYVAISAPVLAQYLARQQASLEEDIAIMQVDLARLADDATLKRWLKEQRAMMKQYEEMDALMEDFLMR